jgi:hypothetical protein
MSTSRKPHRDRPEPTPPRDPFDTPATDRTWWERHAAAVLATSSLVMLALVITLQMAC